MTESTQDVRTAYKNRLLSCMGSIVFVAALSAFTFWAPDASAAQAKKGPIKIGVDTELTGVVAETSGNLKMGYDLYLQEIGGKVAGRQIKIIEGDNKTDYKYAMEVAQRMVEKDRVHILGFGSSTGAALAIRGYAEKSKVR